VPLPAKADFSVGASLGIPAMTAHYALFATGPLAGKTVLVQGGAGAVGFYAVQLAKWGKAAHVVATVSREAQAEQARLAGADTVINYKTEDLVLRPSFLAACARCQEILALLEATDDVVADVLVEEDRDGKGHQQHEDRQDQCLGMGARVDDDRLARVGVVALERAVRRSAPDEHRKGHHLSGAHVRASPW